jgi:hypothetical protein
MRCLNPRGSLVNRDRGLVICASCKRWDCPGCGRFKAKKVAERFSKLGADYLMTVSLPRSAWPTRENLDELQEKMRLFKQKLERSKYFWSAHGWVAEHGEISEDCVCLQPDEARNRGLETPRGCQCGANGNQLHRHYLITLPRGTGRNRFGRPWLPYARLQMFAQEIGLGTLDFQPIFNADGAARYVSKYLAKSLGEKSIARELRTRELSRDRLGRNLPSTYVVEPRRYFVTEPPEEPGLGWFYSPFSVAEYVMLRTGELVSDETTYYEFSVAGLSPP